MAATKCCLKTRQIKLPEKEIIPLEQHGIRADMLSFAAEKIAKRLHEAGFQAYVVGGAVRDLLLGVEPKDFDIANRCHAGANPQSIPPQPHYRPPLPNRSCDDWPLKLLKSRRSAVAIRFSKMHKAEL